jgi:hypothetical protein
METLIKANKKLMDAVIKLHPNLHMDNSNEEALYMAYHDCRNIIEGKAKCTIPVVSGSLPLVSDEEIQKYVTERFSESHLLPEIIAFRAIKYYQQGMPPVSGRRCCLDKSEGKQ